MFRLLTAVVLTSVATTGFASTAAFQGRVFEVRAAANRDTSFTIEQKAAISVDGVPGFASDALTRRRTVTVHPRRGHMIVAFPPAD